MDPFEARLQFIKTLQRLNASVTSNDTATQFMLKHNEVQEDLYSCVLQELGASSINTRLNIFGFLNSLCENISNIYPDPKAHNYCIWLNRDLKSIVEKVVPDGSEGSLNLVPALDILETGSFGQVVDPETLQTVISSLKDASSGNSQNGNNDPTTMARDQILRRMEEDRERAKRTKESIWAIDYKHNPNYEFDMMWENIPPSLNQLDHEQMKEDNEMAIVI